jgi:N-carbamoyl-L-amino-acid hydrolase
MTAISLPRLIGRIEALSRFGGLPGGGVTRSAWSPPYEEARAWLIAQMGAAGLETWVDGAGNVFGATGIKQFSTSTPAVLTGSHIDTVPEGGTLDGALGVLAGLECLHAIVESGAAHRRPLAVAAWIDEEGRYGSLFGSRAFCGMLDLPKVSEMAAFDGERLVDVMRKAGFDPAKIGEARVDPKAVDSYVELHIEQGPRLEEAGLPIGVVQAIVGIRRSRVTFIGQADHAGTTPMERRRDGFLAAADFAVKARDLIVERSEGRAVTNFGVVRVHPGVSNVVPARGELMHEMRSPDPALLDRLFDECQALARAVAQARRVEFEIQPMSRTQPAACAPRVQDAVAQAAKEAGLPTMRMFSGAGHDAQNLALITAAGMLFIPSSGGRSHRIDESSAPDAIERGANVLLRTLLELSNADAR